MLDFFRGEPVRFPAGRDFPGILTQLARTERAHVLLFARLLAQAERIGLPAALASEISASYQQAAALEMLRQQELCRVLDALRQSGLRCLLLKGAGLAYTLYDDPCLRDRCDSDLLFADKSEAERAWLTLQSLGYRRLNTAGGELVSCQFPCVRRTRANDSMLDVHWGISNASRLRRLSFQEMWEASIAIPGLGDGARAPCHEHSLLLACLHRLGHVKDGEHNKLIWLYDLRLLLDALSDAQWRRALQGMEHKELGGACLDGLEQACLHFGAGRYPDRLGELRQLALMPGQQLRMQSSVLARDISQLREQPGASQRLQLLAEYLFPPTDYMMNRFHPRWRWLLPYYYVRRMAAGMGRRLRLHLAIGR